MNKLKEKNFHDKDSLGKKNEPKNEYYWSDLKLSIIFSSFFPSPFDEQEMSVIVEIFNKLIKQFWRRNGLWTVRIVTSSSLTSEN